MYQYDRPTTHKDMLDAMHQCFVAYPEVKEEVRPYGVKRSFPNGMRCDLIFYKKSFNILRFNRGAYMVTQEPILGIIFDEVNKVIGKIKLHNIEDIHHKGIPALIARLPHYSNNIRYDAHLRQIS